MKKTLLALAAFAATSAAFAQSSLTLYGVADVSVEKVKGDHFANRVSSDNLATSRIGFKGTEDVGGGLKTNFVLESAVKYDTGAQGNTARFFDRAAWVGLSGGAGEIRLGRQDSSIGALAGDTAILGAQNYDDLKLIGTRAGDKYRRVDNAITYVLPTVVQGVSAQVQYATAGVGYTAGAIDTAVAGNEVAGSNAGKVYGLSVKYAAGPVIGGLGYLSATDENSVTAGDQKANAVLVYGGYDLGTFKLTAYYDAETKLAGVNRLTIYGAKVTVPVTPDLTVTAGASKAKNILGLTTGNDDAIITEVKAVYSLSKRTAVYALWTNVSNEDAVSKGISGGPTLTAKDAVTGGVAVGVRHNF